MAFQVNITGSVVTLQDTGNNTFAEVYAFGALLNQFAVQLEGVAFNIVDGFGGEAEARQKLTPFFKSAKLSPYVCRVNKASYTFGENKYQLTKYSSHGNAIHGLLYNAMFSVTDSGSDDQSAFVKLQFDYTDLSEGFPFPYTCEVEYRLAENNSLTVATTVTNNGEQLMPVTDGWHPYFALGDTIDDYQLEFQSKEMLEFDGNLIPTGNLIPYQEFGSLKRLGPTFFDNCFTLNFAECQPMCVVRNPARNIQLAIQPAQSYPYLQIYTPDHRRSIAIENLSAAPDAFNNGMGLRVLQPGTELVSFSTTFIIQTLY